MKIIFFGLGSIGLRHASILKRLGGFKLYAFRTFKGQRENHLGIEELTDWKSIDSIQPKIAFITNPTSLHIETAIECAKRNMHLFIEKPLASDLKRLPILLNLVSKRKLTSYVGYVLRFHPTVKAVRKYILKKKKFYHMRVQTTTYLHRWRPGTDSLKTYSAKKRMGGGVIYDLSHELDYVEYLAGNIQSIEGRFARRSRLTVDAEDFVDMMVQTKMGPVNLHVNFFSEREERKVKIDFEKTSIEGDLIKNRLTEFRGSRISREEQFEGTTRDCYEPQIRFFLNNLGNPRMMNNIFEAARFFRKLYAFKKIGRFHD